VTPRPASHPDAAGILCALGAYSIWGVLPVYWKWLSALPATTILSHRIVWSMLFAVLLLSVTRRWRELRSVLSGRATLVPLAASSLLIGGNWLVFIWAVNHARVVETSLGYYLTPLANVALGRIFLKERLPALHLAAVALAAIGVLQLALAATAVPWIALYLAASFALYGLVRKLAPVSPIPGLAVETLILTPVALGNLVWLQAGGGIAFPQDDPRLLTLLLLSGVITATPLLLFATAARRLPLSTLGLLQYIGPTFTLLVAVGVFGEPFTRRQAVTFGFIWAALLLFSLSSVRAFREARREAILAAGP
jgi:chloramphenicol-sensitive protein RarD